MCFHSKQTKLALEVEKRFKVNIDNLSEFQTNININGFDLPKTPGIIDKQSELLTYFS